LMSDLVLSWINCPIHK